MLPTYAVLLGCIFLLGVGTTFLQVAGNPIMRDVSAEGHYSRNLSFAQGIKGIGSTASTYMVSRRGDHCHLGQHGLARRLSRFLCV